MPRRVAVEDNDERLEIRVQRFRSRDTAGALERVFEPFYRVGPAGAIQLARPRLDHRSQHCQEHTAGGSRSAIAMRG